MQRGTAMLAARCLGMGKYLRLLLALAALSPCACRHYQVSYAEPVARLDPPLPGQRIHVNDALAPPAVTGPPVVRPGD